MFFARCHWHHHHHQRRRKDQVRQDCWCLRPQPPQGSPSPLSPPMKRENVFRLERGLFTPRAQYELALDQLTYQARTVQALAMVVIIKIRDFVYLLHCVALIEYPRLPPGSSSLSALGRGAGCHSFLLPEADQILDLGRRASQWICSQPYMIPIEGARVEEEEIFYICKKHRLRSPNLYR